MLCMLMHALHGNHDAHETAAHNPNEPLIEILKRRYALGEISHAQFEQMKRVLSLSQSAATMPQNEYPHQHA